MCFTFGCFEGFVRVRNINFPIVFDAINVIDMRKMFYKCKSLNKIKLSDFNTSNVTNVSGIFGKCPGLTYSIYPHLIDVMLQI